MTRRPRFPGTVPVLGDLSPVKAVPENVPDFDAEMGQKCAQTQSNTSYYGSHLTHRQRRRHMTYIRSSVNNNNLKVAKRKEKETSGAINGMMYINLFTPHLCNNAEIL